MAASPWGGSEELWSQAALRLQEQGHEVSVSVIWRANPSPRIFALEKAGITLSAQKLAGEEGLAVRAWHKLRSRMPLEDQRVKWLRRQRPDLVVISQGGYCDGLEWMEWCNALGLRFVSVVHGNHEINWASDDTAERLAAAYHAAAMVFCVSRHNLELLQHQIGLRLVNAAVVRNPFNVPANQPPTWFADNGCWKLACVARLEVAKGYDLLLQVLSRPEWRQRPVEVNCYGEGVHARLLRRLATHLQLQSVHFRGHVDDVRKIWEGHHLLVLPSRFEGLPLVLVEAMWCARPAVVTDVGGIAEICVDGETGFVAAAPALRLVGETMERAWSRRDEWQRMGLAARARIEKTIPRDPVGDFCQQLLECAKNKN